MNKEIYTLFEKSGAILSGHFVLASGKHSNLYLQSARLLQDPRRARHAGAELKTLCSGLSVDVVISPALGGMIIGYELARQMQKEFIFTERKEGTMQLRRMFEIIPRARYLIVEDVITTGESTLEVDRIVRDGGGKVSGFASLVDRSGGNHCLPMDPYSLLKVQAELFTPESCPMCRQNKPITKPGSKQI